MGKINGYPCLVAVDLLWIFTGRLLCIDYTSEQRKQGVVFSYIYSINDSTVTLAEKYFRHVEACFIFRTQTLETCCGTGAGCT